MNKLLLIALPVALAGSPAMSATAYIVDGFVTGAPERQDITQDTPVSVSGGGNAIGYAGAFSATATNVNGGYAAAYANEGIGNANDYNNEGGADVGADATAAVQYTIRIVGPTTGALVPVDVDMFAYAGSLNVPGPVDGNYAPINVGATAQVSVAYAEGDVPVGAPETLAFVQAYTDYDYRYFEGVAGSIARLFSATGTCSTVS